MTTWAMTDCARSTGGRPARLRSSTKATFKMPAAMGFYSLAAVLVERSSPATLPLLRAELLQEVDAANRGAWHTVRSGRREEFGQIHATLDFIASRVAWQVVAVDVPVTSAAEAALARRRCLGALLEAVCGLGNNAKIVVMDTRDRTLDGAQDRQDLKTAHHLRERGRIGKPVTLVHANDEREPLLWMADTVAWALQRALVRDETQWWEHGREVASVLHARSGEELTLEMQQRPGGPPSHGRLTAPNAVGRGGERWVVAEPLSHRRQDASRETFAPTPDPHERSIMDSLRAQVRAIEQRQREDAAHRRGAKPASPPGADPSQRDDALPSLTPGQLIATGMRSGAKPMPPLLKPGAEPASASREQPRPPKAPRPSR